MKLLCRNNDGYQWTERPGGCFRGYFQLLDRPEPFRGEEALRYFAQADSFERFQELLKAADGCYAVILRREDGTVWAAVDAVRSMPLYYSTDGRFLSDSGPAVREALGIPREAADPAALEVYFYHYYIPGPRTVYKEIAQLDAGQTMERSPSGEIRTVYYYAHIQKTRDIGWEEALDLFQQISDEAFDKVIAAIAGRPVVLSLSGGYDSRYVACMLKRRGVEDVSCYTYGRKDSFEIQQSRRIAEALGWRWAFVEYTDERRSFLRDPVAKSYIQKTESYDSSVPYDQNLPAVQYLHETGWIKPGSVFLTGLLNDWPTGSHSSPPPSELTREAFERAVCGDGRAFKNMSEPARVAFLEGVERQRHSLGLSWSGPQEFLNAVDCLGIIRPHCRKFLHMNDVHEYFGYEWLLPCGNRKLLEFWYSMPMEYRLSQSLFAEWITTRVPAQYGVGQKKNVLGYPTSHGWKRTKARMGVLLRRGVFLPLGIPFRGRTDINNEAPIAAELFPKIHQKRLIGFRNSNRDSILTLYLMEQRFGPRCLETR